MDLGSTEWQIVFNLYGNPPPYTITDGGTWFDNPEAEAGHIYAVQTRDGDVALVRLNTLDEDDVEATIDWVWLSA
jgi:hypothetical protein